jgi:hypothetical protein
MTKTEKSRIEDDFVTKTQRQIIYDLLMRLAVCSRMTPQQYLVEKSRLESLIHKAEINSQISSVCG